MENNLHESVLVEEVAEALHIEKGKRYIDATAGNGGHTRAILKRGGKVLGIELDPKMLLLAENRLKGEKTGEWKLVNGNFIDIDEISKSYGWEQVDGIIFDLGVTNLHLKDTNRGFSFANTDAALDMRINPEKQGITGSDLLNILREDQLRQLFEATLDKGSAKWITGRVLHSRAIKPIATVGDFLEICEGLKTRNSKINEATLPFLALRIAVNSELTNLEEVLPKAFNLLNKGGRMAVISFHSKEDALVKSFFKKMAMKGAKQVSYRPITAGEKELEVNKRARSAKMRILEK